MITQRIDARVRHVVKASNETVNNSTVYQDDDELVAPCDVSRKYLIELFLNYTSSVGADIKFQLSLPAGATSRAGITCFASTALSNTTGQFANTPTAGGNDATQMSWWGQKIVEIGATAGNIQLQWAQNTAEVSNTILLAGSFMRVTLL